MKKDNSVLRRVRKTKKNSDLHFFHREYWTTLKNDKNNFSAERKFIKINFGEIFKISNFLDNPEYLEFQNYDNIVKKENYSTFVKISFLKQFFEDINTTDKHGVSYNADTCSNLKESCTFMLSKILYGYIIICLFFVFGGVFDWMLFLFINILFVFPVFLFIYLGGLYQRFGIKIKVDTSHIYCSRVNCFNKESVVINKKITAGDYVIAYKIKERISVYLENINSKKSHKVCVDISEQEANYLVKKINNVIAKDTEVSL